MTPGGYQIIDFNNTEVSTEQATIVTSKNIANILRMTNKPVFITGLKCGSDSISAPLSVTDTGAHDAKVYTTPIVISNNYWFTITTDDDNIRFVPAAISI